MALAGLRGRLLENAVDNGRLEKILKKRPIDWDLIARNYDQMVKYATALRPRSACAPPRPTR